MRSVMLAVLCISICATGNISYSQETGGKVEDCARNILSLELGLPYVGYFDWNLRYMRLIDSNYAAMAGFSLLGNTDEGSHNRQDEKLHDLHFVFPVGLCAYTDIGDEWNLSFTAGVFIEAMYRPRCLESSSGTYGEKCFSGWDREIVVPPFVAIGIVKPMLKSGFTFSTNLVFTWLKEDTYPEFSIFPVRLTFGLGWSF